jgi:hypothetical protein
MGPEKCFKLRSQPRSPLKRTGLESNTTPSATTLQNELKEIIIHNDFNTNILLHKIKQHFDLIYFGIYLLKIADSM